MPAGARARSGRRVVVRWAWRMFRREWRQQLLVLTLVTVGVAVGVAGSSIAVNAASQPNGFGDALARLTVDTTDPAAADRVVAAAAARYGTVEVIEHRAVEVPGSAQQLDVRSQAPDGVYGHPMLGLRDGRYPTSSAEVGLTRGAADVLGAELGGQVVLGGVPRTVVGVVENPDDLDDEFALLAPGDGTPVESLTILLASADGDGPPVPVTEGADSRPVVRLETVVDDEAVVVASALVVSTLAMAFACLLASAGFVVVAQRRQRQLGLLAAIGATDRHLRLVVLANGAIVGAVAALVGAVVGVLAWLAAAPAVEAASAHRIEPFALPWGLIAACMALAVLGAVAAAWWPARTMARVPVMEALSRRPPRSQPVHRSLAAAVALLALGVGAIAAADPVGDHVRPLVLIGGLVAVVVGVVLVAPAAIRTLAAPAGRLPFAPRLALRDLVRHQARAAAALAAIALALGTSVAVVVVAQASEPHQDQGNLSDGQLLIGSGDGAASLGPDLDAEALARLDAAAATVAAEVPGASLLPLDVAVPASGVDPGLPGAVVLVRRLAEGRFRDLAPAYVATPAVLAHAGIDPATVQDDTDLLTARRGDLLLLDFGEMRKVVDPGSGDVRPPDRPTTPVQHVDLPAYTSAPTALITEAAMARHGWLPARIAWLVESASPLTSTQVDAARRAAASVGLTVEARSGNDGAAALRTGATIVGSLLALAIVAMTVGLTRSEAGRDVRTLTATGATGRTRRTLTATTAAALAVLGVVLGMVGAYAALLAAYHTDLGELAGPPVRQLALLAVGLPAVAAAGGWLLAGREPTTFSRELLD